MQRSLRWCGVWRSWFPCPAREPVFHGVTRSDCHRSCRCARRDAGRCLMRRGCRWSRASLVGSLRDINFLCRLLGLDGLRSFLRFLVLRCLRLLPRNVSRPIRDVQGASADDRRTGGVQQRPEKPGRSPRSHCCPWECDRTKTKMVESSPVRGLRVDVVEGLVETSHHRAAITCFELAL